MGLTDLDLEALEESWVVIKLGCRPGKQTKGPVRHEEASKWAEEK